MRVAVLGASGGVTRPSSLTDGTNARAGVADFLWRQLEAEVDESRTPVITVAG